MAKALCALFNFTFLLKLHSLLDLKYIFSYFIKGGLKLCERYREIREHCLIKAFETLGVDHKDLSELARTLRSLSGLYDQAARAATSF